MGECRDVKALRTDLLRSAFWPLSHKSGVILSLSLITVAWDSTSTFVPQPRLLYHNCGLVLGLILLALASIGFSCLGLRPVANMGQRGHGLRQIRVHFDPFSI